MENSQHYPDMDSAMRALASDMPDADRLPALSTLLGDEAVVMMDEHGRVAVAIPDLDDDGVEVDFVHGMELSDRYDAIGVAVENIYADLTAPAGADPIAQWTTEEAEAIVEEWTTVVRADLPASPEGAEARLRHQIERARTRMGLLGIARAHLHAEARFPP